MHTHRASQRDIEAVDGTDTAVRCKEGSQGTERVTKTALYSPNTSFVLDPLHQTSGENSRC